MTASTPVLRFISLDEAINILDEYHCSGIGRKVLESGIKQGVFDFGKCVEMGNNRYIISMAKLMKFIEENLYNEPVDPSILEFERQYLERKKEEEKDNEYQ